MAAFGFSIGAFALGVFAGSKSSPWVLLSIWDAALFIFLIAWLSGLMIELQRSESIDLNRLLHLPVTLNQVFVFNYLASHLTPSIILFVPAMLALCAGLTLSSGPSLALLAPLVLAFVLMITAWTYCLRGWLTALMMNKRRRRAVLVWITILLVLVGQLPNLIFNSSYLRKHRGSKTQQQQTAKTPPSRKDTSQPPPEGLLEAHLLLPPGWLAYSAVTLRGHNPWPASAATVAAGLLAALGLMRAYRLTIRSYLGADDGQIAKSPRHPTLDTQSPHSAFRIPHSAFLERRLPWLPDDTAGLTLATFRSLLRSPELKMAAIMPMMVGLVMFFAHQNIPKGKIPQALAPFAATAAVALAAFSFSQPMSNSFGLDRNGFRALVLLPTRRHHILLAKNLAFFPFVALVALGLVSLAQWLAHMSWSSLLTALFQFPTAFLLISLMANLSSILVPYRMSQTLKAKNQKLPSSWRSSFRCS
jgi:hypothetical protein